MPFLLLLLPVYASAIWPTTIRENLPISTDPLPYAELHPFAFPYPDGRTLVVFYKNYFGHLYQIVDRYGNSQFPEPQLLQPAFPPNGYVMWLQAISDGQGGVIACWTKSDLYPPPPVGIYAQRIDSLGNLCWGDSAVHVAPHPESGWEIGPDGRGGMFFSWAKPDGNLYAQRVSAQGELQWGPGVIVCQASGSQGLPQLAPDGQGGTFVVWLDQRLSIWGATFMQRLDENGRRLWDPDGLFACDPSGFQQIIPDGEGGFLLHVGGGVYDNWVYRIAPNGRILWNQDHVSWTMSAQIVPGDSGFFYLGFPYDTCIYGQKMDIRGHFYWPNWNTGQIGALMADRSRLGLSIPFLLRLDFAYRDAFFYAMFNEGTETMPFINRHWLQALDAEGHRRWHGNGVLFSVQDSIAGIITNDFNVIPDDSLGAVCVWNYGYEAGLNNDVWAKRVNAEGSLGGAELAVTRAPSPEKGTLRGLSGGEATFTLNLAQPQYLSLTIYNVRGQEVARVFDGYRAAGRQEITFTASDLPSGVYFARLAGEEISQVVKVVLLK